MFNKDLEEIKKSQLIRNNAITEIKSSLAGTNSRITEAEDRISYRYLSYLYTAIYRYISYSNVGSLQSAFDLSYCIIHY